MEADHRRVHARNLMHAAPTGATHVRQRGRSIILALMRCIDWRTANGNRAPEGNGIERGDLAAAVPQRVAYVPEPDPCWGTVTPRIDHVCKVEPEFSRCRLPRVLGWRESPRGECIPGGEPEVFVASLQHSSSAELRPTIGGHRQFHVDSPTDVLPTLQIGIARHPRHHLGPGRLRGWRVPTGDGSAKQADCGKESEHVGRVRSNALVHLRRSGWPGAKNFHFRDSTRRET